MYKTIAGTVAGLLICTAVHAANTSLRAVEIDINGIGPGVDDYAFRTVRQTIGLAVANGVVDGMTVYGYGREGGFSACVAASPEATDARLLAFVRQLRTIQADVNTTAYSVRRVEACAPASP